MVVPVHGHADAQSRALLGFYYAAFIDACCSTVAATAMSVDQTASVLSVLTADAALPAACCMPRAVFTWYTQPRSQCGRRSGRTSVDGWPPLRVEEDAAVVAAGGREQASARAGRGVTLSLGARRGRLRSRRRIIDGCVVWSMIAKGGRRRTRWFCRTALVATAAAAVASGAAFAAGARRPIRFLSSLVLDAADNDGEGTDGLSACPPVIWASPPEAPFPPPTVQWRFMEEGGGMKRCAATSSTGCSPVTVAAAAAAAAHSACCHRLHRGQHTRVRRRR